MSSTRTLIVTAGIMMSLFLASMESTVVATAMPTIVGQLGGLNAYSWVFTAYMLTSTTMVPIFGKLSDIYGIRPVYLVAVILFLAGSILCGMATSMPALIIFRAIQGIGAGGILPLAFTIIAAIFSFEQRARMQGLFSGVWGVSAVIGPLLGGFLVDNVSWRWVFYLNILPGLLAMAFVWFALIEKDHSSKHTRPPIDYPGLILLTLSIVLLLLGLAELGNPTSIGLLLATIVCIAILARIEQAATDPIVPLQLFKTRTFAVACGHGLLAGFAMFGSTSFVPFFAQTVLGTSATGAGATLIPMMLSWVFASIIGTRLLLRIQYRTLSLIGTGLLTIGSAMLCLPFGPQSNTLQLMLPTGLMGIGMGLSIPSFLLAVQNSVARNQLGSATSTLQFSRSIGGTFGVSLMGLALALSLNAALQSFGIDPSSISLNSLIDPAPGTATPALNEELRQALAIAMRSVFLLALGTAALSFIITSFAPRGTIGRADEQSTVEVSPG